MLSSISLRSSAAVYSKTELKMSSEDARPRRHRHTRSAVMPSAIAPSQADENPRNPKSPHHLDLQAHAQTSETELSSNSLFDAPRLSTPPHTPRKDTRPSTQNTSMATETESKQKPRSKHRPKNVVTSPAVVRKNRNATPPFTGAQSAGLVSSKQVNTPTAYAGSTFHASPAPSALPIPSFYSKSVPDSPAFKGPKSLKGVALPTATSTPPRMTPPADQNREESPLDFFFRADREEKARAQGLSSSKVHAAVNGPFPPPLESPLSGQTPPTRSHQRPKAASNRTSAGGIFAMELDGDRTPGMPLGPAFSTPYSERINAARSAKQSSGFLEGISREPQSSSDSSEALKAYLFSNHSASLATHPTSPQPQDASASQQPSAPLSGPRSAGLPVQLYHNSYALGSDLKTSNRAEKRSSGLRQEVTPSKTPTRILDRGQSYGNSPPSSVAAPGNSYSSSEFASQSTSPSPYGASASSAGILPENSDSKIQGMEESLRRILKLGSVTNPGSNIGQSAPSVATPYYDGGRPPPASGYNGVMGS